MKTATCLVVIVVLAAVSHFWGFSPISLAVTYMIVRIAENITQPQNLAN